MKSSTFASIPRAMGATVATLMMIATVGPVSGARAATISHDIPFILGGSLVVDGGDTFGQKQTHTLFQFSQFDPSMGTLTDVTFNLTSILGNEILGNEFGTPFEVFLIGYDSTPIHSTADSVYTPRITDSVSGVLFESPFANHADCQKSSGLCQVRDNQHNNEAYNGSFSPIPPLSGYLGSGHYDVTFTEVFELSVAALVTPGKAEASLVAPWRGDLEVVYTYGVVPEPTTSVLLGLGLVALTGITKRKQGRSTR